MEAYTAGSAGDCCMQAALCIPEHPRSTSLQVGAQQDAGCLTAALGSKREPVARAATDRGRPGAARPAASLSPAADATLLDHAVDCDMQSCHAIRSGAMFVPIGARSAGWGQAQRARCNCGQLR